MPYKCRDPLIDPVLKTLRKAEWRHFQLLAKPADRLVTIDRVIDWVIVGDESGPGACPMEVACEASASAVATSVRSIDCLHASRQKIVRESSNAVPGGVWWM